MRIRTIKPEFWDDEKIGQLSRSARLLFLATFNAADDEGLLRWTSEYLKSLAFVYDEDISITETAAMMREVTNLGLVFFYTAGPTKQRLAYIVNFRKHQKINRPQASKLTPPRLSNPDVADMYLRRDGWVCHLCGGPIPNQYQTVIIDPYSPTETRQDTQAVNASLDHVLPRSAGGNDYPSNIKIAHLACNKSRRERGAEDFSPPSSVTRALEYLERAHPEQLTSSRSSSLNDSVNDCIQIVTASPDLSTERELFSLNGSLNDSPQEGKGREGKGSKPPPPPCSARADDRFEEFWAAYPRRVDRKDAEKAWAKAIKAHSPDRIIVAAKRYGTISSSQGQKYIKYPATWLNKCCYLDEPETPDLWLVPGDASRRDPKSGRIIESWG